MHIKKDAHTLSVVFFFNHLMQLVVIVNEIAKNTFVAAGCAVFYALLLLRLKIKFPALLRQKSFIFQEL